MKSYIWTMTLSAAFWLIMKPVFSLSLTDWINYSFMGGLIFLMAGAVFWILRSGFMDLFLLGFRKLGAYAVIKPKAMDHIDEMVKDDEHYQAFRQRVGHLVTAGSLLAAAGSLLVSAAGMTLYLL